MIARYCEYLILIFMSFFSTTLIIKRVKVNYVSQWNMRSEKVMLPTFRKLPLGKSHFRYYYYNIVLRLSFFETKYFLTSSGYFWDLRIFSKNFKSKSNLNKKRQRDHLKCVSDACQRLLKLFILQRFITSVGKLISLESRSTLDSKRVF